MARLTVFLVVLLVALALPESTFQQLLSENIGDLPLPSVVRLEVIDARTLGDIWTLVRSHMKEILWLMAGMLILLELYNFFVKPLNIVRRLEDRGYIKFEKKTTMKDTAADVAKRRQRGDLPPVYPNGWFRVCDSHDIKVRIIIL